MSFPATFEDRDTASIERFTCPLPFPSSSPTSACGDLQAGLAKIIERYSKVAPLLPVKKIDNLTHKYGKETSLGGVTTRSINVPFEDVAASTVTPQEEGIVLGGRRVETDYRLNQLNNEARANETTRAMRALTRWMDDQIFNGKATTVVGVDGKSRVAGINGFRERCRDKQLISAGANGAALTLDLFNAGLDAVVDQGNGIHAFMNKATYRALKTLKNLRDIAIRMTPIVGAGGAYAGSRYPSTVSVPVQFNEEKFARLAAQIFEPIVDRKVGALAQKIALEAHGRAAKAGL